MDGKRTLKWPRAAVFGIGAILVSTITALVAWRLTSDGDEYEQLRALDSVASPVASDPDVESRIAAFCGDCHAMPRAENLPRDAWYDKVKQGYLYYAKSGRNDLEPPPIHQTVSYFRSKAPKQFVFPIPIEAANKLNATFSSQKLALDQDDDIPVAISHLRWTCLKQDAAPVLLACDMQRGSVASVDLRGDSPRRSILARLNNPCHVEPCDLDGDGVIELVVADLGSSNPDDHDRGRVVWLQCDASTNSYTQTVLASGMGRVADVRPADVDSDGDTDLVVAEFGHYRTGSIVLLKNVAAAGEEPRFESLKLDDRPGTIHVPVLDLNRDGSMDVLALCSQEYESVDVFLNQGGTQFHQQSLWAAEDLTFGSSGIEPVDLDQDGDTDVLYTNGDSFDNMYITPTQGVQWLENLGDMRFAYHRLADMPGAYRALAGDIDGDGDLDVIACAWLPRQALPANVRKGLFASVICLEQTQPGRFVHHTLERGSQFCATLELADFDDDGDLDFALGSLLPNTRILSHWLAIWWNQKVRNPKSEARNPRQIRNSK